MEPQPPTSLRAVGNLVDTRIAERAAARGAKRSKKVKECSDSSDRRSTVLWGDPEHGNRFSGLLPPFEYCPEPGEEDDEKAAGASEDHERTNKTRRLEMPYFTVVTEFSDKSRPYLVPSLAHEALPESVYRGSTRGTQLLGRVGAVLSVKHRAPESHPHERGRCPVPIWWGPSGPSLRSQGAGLDIGL